MLFSLLESEGNAVDAQRTNQAALDALAKQNFAEAQALFFENARKNPSYQTFNNLGYYLIISRKSTPARWGSAPRFPRFLSEE